jgi:hypothetical protein
MHGLGRQFLAAAAFAANQHRGVSGSDLAQLQHQGLDRSTLAKDSRRRIERGRAARFRMALQLRAAQRVAQRLHQVRRVDRHGVVIEEVPQNQFDATRRLLRRG